ncbi:MAG: hypothetical protein GDA48_02895 [Hormoscilla sp. GM102CHS1]|nr:hypothetical protein [Hormoscilla sp. GM102CHS1]
MLNIGIDAKIVPETRFLVRENGAIAHYVPGRDRDRNIGRGTASTDYRFFCQIILPPCPALRQIE